MNQTFLICLTASATEPLELIKLGGWSWSEAWRIISISFVLALALGLFMMGLLRIINRDRARHGPTVRRLCQALAIDIDQRKLLVDLAAKSGRTSAASLLISRGAYDAAMQQYAPVGVQASQLKTVRRKIFGK